MKSLKYIILVVLSVSALANESICLNYVGECHRNILKAGSYLSKAYQTDEYISYQENFKETASFVYRATITGTQEYCAVKENENFKDTGKTKFGVLWNVVFSSSKCKKKFRDFNIVNKPFMQNFESINPVAEKAYESSLDKCEYYRQLLLDSVIGC